MIQFEVSYYYSIISEYDYSLTKLSSVITILITGRLRIEPVWETQMTESLKRVYLLNHMVNNRKYLLVLLSHVY